MFFSFNLLYIVTTLFKNKLSSLEQQRYTRLDALDNKIIFLDTKVNALTTELDEVSTGTAAIAAYLAAFTPFCLKGLTSVENIVLAGFAYSKTALAGVERTIKLTSLIHPK